MNPDFEEPIIEIEKKLAELKELNAKPNVQFDTEIAELENKSASLRKKIYADLTPWQTVQVARHPDRPLFKNFISGIFSEFIELHGDRYFRDDRSIIGGFASIENYQVMLIGHHKGKNVKENIEANFGMANPEGYRKALRLMKMAEKYRIPIISFIDTPGTYPGVEAESRGQAEAIARNLTEMATLQVPILVVVTGEGGSGGALGIGVGDVIIMLSNAVYSVISPEGCAAILWRDGSKAPAAAQALKITADSLHDLGIVDEVIPEPPGGAHRASKTVITAVKKALLKYLKRFEHIPPKKLVEKRFDKYSKIGRL